MTAISSDGFGCLVGPQVNLDNLLEFVVETHLARGGWDKSGG